jgi:superfamily II DNA or RNA helicase
MLKEITGEEPTVVLSEDGPAANAAIEEFAESSGRWLVAVRMVSEGVDVPRLAVGVYATKTKTEMFFRQAVGRFVRRQRDEEHAAGAARIGHRNGYSVGRGGGHIRASFGTRSA